MVYEPSQKETLEIAWKRGYLSSNKYYELLSKLTGLSRTQISNWATRKIRKLGIRNAPLPSAYRDPVVNAGQVSDSKRFLEIAWERGLLPGTKNYTIIQDFTNLTRIQISNWSSRRVRKLKKDQLNGNFSHSSKMMMRTPQPTRKRSLKVKRQRIVKGRVAVPRQPTFPELVRWLLMNAVRGLANINEEKIRLLSTLIGCPKEEVRKFLLANGRSIEEEGGSLKEQLPVMEKIHFVSEQQQNTPLQLKAQPVSDKPIIKREGIEDLKEKSLEEVGNLPEQLHVMEKTHLVPEQQQSTSSQQTHLVLEQEQSMSSESKAEAEPAKLLIKREEVDEMKENLLSKTTAADTTV